MNTIFHTKVWRTVFSDENTENRYWIILHKWLAILFCLQCSLGLLIPLSFFFRILALSVFVWSIFRLTPPWNYMLSRKQVSDNHSKSAVCFKCKGFSHSIQSIKIKILHSSLSELVKLLEKEYIQTTPVYNCITFSKLRVFLVSTAITQTLCYSLQLFLSLHMSQIYLSALLLYQDYVLQLCL